MSELMSKNTSVQPFLQTITIISIVLVVAVAIAGVWQNLNLQRHQQATLTPYDEAEINDFALIDPAAVASSSLLEVITPQNFNEQLAYTWAWHQHYASTNLPQDKEKFIQELSAAKAMFDNGDRDADLNCFFMWDIISDETLDNDSRNLARTLCYEGKHNINYGEDYAPYWERLQKGQTQIANGEGAFWYYYPDRIIDDYMTDLANRYSDFLSGNRDSFRATEDSNTAAKLAKQYALAAIDKNDLAYNIVNPTYSKDLQIQNENKMQIIALAAKLFSWYQTYGEQNFDVESNCLMRKVLVDLYNRYTAALGDNFLNQLPNCPQQPTYLAALVNRGHYDTIDIDPVDVLNDVRENKTTDNYERIIMAGLLSQ